MKLNKQLQLKKKADSGDIESIYEYGMLLYLETSDYETALRYLLAAASEEYELAYGEIGIILYNKKNDIVGAESWFQRAEKANCLYGPSAYEYGMLTYLEKRNYEDALKYLLKAANEEYEPAYGFIATILYREKNDIESAEIWFKKAEKANCLFAPVAYEYGMLKYYERRDYEIALRYLLKSAEDDYELSYGVIGIIYYAEKHELNNALNWFRKAEKVNCLFAPAAYEYGMLFLEKGDIDQALKYLLIAAEDNYDLAYEELVKIYHESGDHENEKMWYKRIEEETIS